MKQIILENRGLIRAIIRKLTGSYNDDIEQEVYIKTWKNIGQYHEEGKFRQWISCLTANVCRDYFRGRQYKQGICENSEDDVLDNVADVRTPEKSLSSRQRQKIILKAVDDLPEKYKKIVIWFEFEELSYEQIAKKTNLPLGTVKSRLSTARKILADKLSFLKGE